MRSHLRFSTVIVVLAVFAAPAAFADMGGGSTREERVPTDMDVVSADKAIKDKNWAKAVEHLTKAVARDDKNADLHNKLGYSERKRGNLNAAFKHYERALALDPKHRGAHEYIGEAYLQSGNLAKAEEHLAALDKLCTFSCEEYRDLKTAIAEYKQKRQAAK
jgi:tetratricopeptide (TPR) repeat protein